MPVVAGVVPCRNIATAMKTTSSTNAPPAHRVAMSKPGEGSANSAGPTGVHHDSAIARPTASTRPTTIATANRIIEVTNRSLRVTPRAASVRLSRPSSWARRETAWPTSSVPSRAVMAAKMSNAVAAGSVARSAFARVTARVGTIFSPGTIASTAALNSSRRSGSVRRTVAPP